MFPPGYTKSETLEWRNVTSRFYKSRPNCCALLPWTQISFLQARESNQQSDAASVRWPRKPPLKSFRTRCLMRCRSFLRSFSPSPFTNKPRLSIVVTLAVLFFAWTCAAQEQSSENQANSPPQPSSVTIPAGTQVALVLTQPIQSRHVHRGDDIYAQVISPVHSEHQVAIPPGTFVQGTVDKIRRNGGRGEIRLQSMSITFPDGYVTQIPGPMTLMTDEGYAIKDPGSTRTVAAVAMPLAGAGIGAAIGHSIAPGSSTLTASVPPGCTGPPPGCVSSSMTVPGNAGRNTVIGAGVGAAIGGVASLALMFGTNHFFLDVGAPVQMKLQQPITMSQDEVTKAVLDSEKHQVTEQAVALRPAASRTGLPGDNGTCYTPGTPGTPPTVIPGPPGPDGIPGSSTMIPGTPPTPGTPYPCP